jgi:hypothetical protein
MGQAVNPENVLSGLVTILPEMSEDQRNSIAAAAMPVLATIGDNDIKVRCLESLAANTQGRLPSWVPALTRQIPEYGTGSPAATWR